MAWITFERLEYDPAMVSRTTGKTYAGYRLQGIKRGYGNMPDAPYEKVLFDNTTATVIEKGVKRPGMSVIEFIKKAVQPGDTIDMKQQRRGQFWEITTIENITNKTPTYEPLSDSEAERLRLSQELPEAVMSPAMRIADDSANSMTTTPATQFVGYSAQVGNSNSPW